MMRVILPFAAVLSACSEAPAPPTPRESPPVAVVPTMRPGVLGADAGAALRGELRCGFEAGGKSLLLAAADVDQSNRATAVIALDGVSRSLLAASPGGFDTLRLGGRFAGDGLRVAIIRGAEHPTGHEGSRHDATLTVAAGASEHRVDGSWTCGP